MNRFFATIVSTVILAGGLLMTSSDAAKNPQIEAAHQEEIKADHAWAAYAADLEKKDVFDNAWKQNEKALAAWASVSDRSASHTPYFKILRRMATPLVPQGDYDNRYLSTLMSRETLDQAIALAQTPEEKAYAHYLSARLLLWHAHDLPLEKQKKLRNDLKELLRLGRSSGWYDYALFHYPDVAGPERKRWDAQVRIQPDYELALVNYKKIQTEFKKGESEFLPLLESHIREITEPLLQLATSEHFQPPLLRWRNIRHADFAVYTIALPPAEKDKKSLPTVVLNELNNTSITGKTPLKTWSKTLPAEHHIPGEEAILELADLPPGAYIVEAKSDALRTQSYFRKRQ